MELQKKSEDFNTDGELWSEETRVISFSCYPIKLTLGHQEDVSEAEKYVGLVRLFCDLLSVQEQIIRKKIKLQTEERAAPENVRKRKNMVSHRGCKKRSHKGVRRKR